MIWTGALTSMGSSPIFFLICTRSWFRYRRKKWYCCCSVMNSPPEVDRSKGGRRTTPHRQKDNEMQSLQATYVSYFVGFYCKRPSWIWQWSYIIYRNCMKNKGMSAKLIVTGYMIYVTHKGSYFSWISEVLIFGRADGTRQIKK